MAAWFRGTSTQSAVIDSTTNYPYEYVIRLGLFYFGLAWFSGSVYITLYVNACENLILLLCAIHSIRVHLD